jgi:hypothetical protein
MRRKRTFDDRRSRRQRNNDGVAMRKNKNLTIALLFASAFLIYHTYYYLFGEQSYSQIGIRWDQKFYFDLTRNFESFLLSKQIPIYEFQRILPAGIINLTMQIMGIALTLDNILHAFDIYNSILMFATLWVWYLINQKAKITTFGFVVGIIGLFCNSAYLKIYLYQPINTDSMALLLGTALIYAHIIKNKGLMVAIIFLSSFTWPSATLFGLILLFGNSISCSNFRDKTVQTEKFKLWRSILAVLIALVPVCTVLMLLFVLKWKMPHGTTPIVYGLLPLSLLFLGGYIYVLAKSVLLKLDLTPVAIKAGLKEVSCLNIALCALLFLSVKYLIANYAGSQTGALNFTSFIRNITLSSVTVPFKFIIAHISYFGPVVLLLIFFWHKFIDRLFLYDMGVLGFVGAHLVQAIGAESRQLVFAYPFLIFIMVGAIHQMTFKKYFAIVFLLTSLFYSRFWYTINQQPFPSLDDPGDYFQSFPWQHFAMFNGAWLSNQVYLVMMPIVLMTAIMYYFVYVRVALKLEQSTGELRAMEQRSNP